MIYCAEHFTVGVSHGALLAAQISYHSKNFLKTGGVLFLDDLTALVN
jgi:hypothetical protein